jgi:hypothetical protein
MVLPRMLAIVFLLGTEFLSVTIFSLKNWMYPWPVLCSVDESCANGIEPYVSAMSVKVFVVSNAMLKKVTLKRHATLSCKITLPALDQRCDVIT